VSPVIGGLVGAVIVGGVWYGTHLSQQHGDVVAKVGGTPITRQTLLQESESYAGTQMLEQLITNQLVLDAAAKQKVTASDKEVNSALQSLEEQDGISSDAQLESMLAQSHMTKAQLMEQLKVEVLEEKIAENKVKVTAKQIQTYYNNNKKNLASAKKVSLSDIIVSTKAKAQNIKKQLDAGQSFATLAKKNSTDTSTKSKGGKMGSMTQDQLDPAIAPTAFKMKKGQISDPIKVSTGYELIQVNDITPSVVPTLAKAKSQITTILKQQNMEQPQELVADLMKKDNVQILDSSYSSVKEAMENPSPSSSSGVSE
jgi:foldase protein PrsA